MQTNLYANRNKNEFHFCVEKEELLEFLGVLSLAGYHSLLGEHHYRSHQPDMGVSIVSKELSRKRFLSKKSKIHFVDNNTLHRSNKMTKIEPLYSTLNASFINYRVFHNRLSIDKSIIPFYRPPFKVSRYDLVTSSGVSVDLMDILISWIFTQANVKHTLNPLDHRL